MRIPAAFARVICVSLVVSVGLLPAATAKDKKPVDKAALDATIVKGNQCYARKDFAGAIAAYNNADKLSQHNCPDCLLALYQIYKRVGELGYALDEAKKALKESGDNKIAAARAHESEAILLAAMAGHKPTDKKLAQAVEDLRATIGLNPSDAMAHYNLGVLLMRQEKDAEGTAELKTYLASPARNAADSRKAETYIANPLYAREPIAPDFSFTTVEGTQISLQGLKGKVALLDFWGTWCPPCRESVPTLVALHKRFAGKPVEFVGISSDSDQNAWKTFIAAHHMDWPEYIDLSDAVQETFEIDSFPTYIVIDPQGMIRFRQSGFDEQMSGVELEDAINRALKEKPPKEEQSSEGMVRPGGMRQTLSSARAVVAPMHAHLVTASSRDAFAAPHSQQQGSQSSGTGSSAAQKSANGAGSTAAAAAIDPQFKANIMKLLDVTHAMAIGQQAAKTMFAQLRPTLVASLPPTPHREQIVDAYAEKLTALLVGPEVVDRLAAVYARHLSPDDVTSMIQFYDTPAGQHALASMPQIVAESQQIGANAAQENIPRIFGELCTEFPELQGKVKFCPAGTQKESSEGIGNPKRELHANGPSAAHIVTVSLGHLSPQGAEQSAAPAALVIPGSEMETRLRHVVPPVYPQIALIAHVTGTVRIRIMVASDGRAQNIAYISGPALLKDAAMNAVRQWTFQPYMEDGVSVPVDTTMSVVFSIASKPKANRVPENVMLGRLVHKVPPEYPAKTKAAQISGAVVLDAVVKEDGRVGKIRVVSGPSELAKAAQDAVKRWKFEPTVHDGMIVPVETTLTVNFDQSAAQ